LSRAPVSAKTGDAVINLRSSLFIVALAAGGCQKAPDVDKMQSQALLTVRSYAGQLDVLQRRADTLLTKYRAMGSNLPGAAEASRRLGQARSDLEQLRAFANGVPGMFAGAANKSPEQLQEAIDTTDAKLVEGTLKITGDLTAFENWSAFARPTPPHAPPPPPPAAPSEATGEPAPAPDTEGK
jgi:hypothetical protein